MGADNFFCVASGSSSTEAFDNAVKDAYYWYGHAGYTGTVCEKEGYVMASDQTFDELTIEKIDEALMMSYQRAGGEEYDFLKSLLGDKTDNVINDYNNKWGPAICIKCDDGRFFFCGFASS